MSALALSLAMIAVFALAVGAVALFRRGDRRRALLMLVAAAVILANVLIWTVPLPTAGGAT